MLLWMFYASVVMFGVFRPMEYRSATDSGTLRYVHLTMVTAGIILPVIPVLICHWVEGYGIDLVLNYSCVPRNRSAYAYTLAIPFSVCGMTAISMLILIGTEIGRKVIKISKTLSIGSRSRLIKSM